MAVLEVDARCTLGEGITWWAAREALLWTDIQSSRLWFHSPEDGSTRSWALPDRLGSLAICASGRLLLGFAKSLAYADLDASPGDELEVRTVHAVEPDIATTRINDGRTDRAGNFVFGTMNEDEGKAPLGSFYQYTMRFGLRRLSLGGIHIPNSICFSLDGRTMYYCDSTARRIMRCDYDALSASVSNVREFVTFDDQQGTPDGSIIDSDDQLWNAEWGAARVRRYSAGRRHRSFRGGAGQKPDLRRVRRRGDGRPVHHIVAAGDDTRGTDAHPRRRQRVRGVAHRLPGSLRRTLP